MASEYSRTQRVADQLQKELARFIQQEIKDPRLGMTTVSAVDVTRDLAYARVYVTFFGCEDNKQEIDAQLEILNKASGFLRKLIAKAIKLRIVPQLKFEFDASISRGQHLSSLIGKAIAQDQQHPGYGDDADDSEKSED